jgi:hypothetical protein
VVSLETEIARRLKQWQMPPRALNGPAPHRARRRLPLRPADIGLGIVLALVSLLIWVHALPWISSGWYQCLRVGVERLRLDATVELVPYHFGPMFRVDIPALRMRNLVPHLWTWGLTALACFGLLAISFRLPPRLTPVTYAIRLLVAIQGSALAYFAILPARFPESVESVTGGLMSGGTMLITLVPIIHGLVYYIFDFGMLRKAVLTALTMIHLIVLLPLQCLVEGAILHQSLLFVPLLYMVFGVPLDILMIMCFYAWGMSWRLRGMEAAPVSVHPPEAPPAGEQAEVGSRAAGCGC